MLFALATFAALELVTDEAWRAASSDDHVNALLHRVPEAHKRRCEGVLRGANRRGFSQAWQDWILYRNFFAGRTDGLYVDIGTNDPLQISNSAFFDLCLGWKGICFEPQPRYHAAIRGKRTCALVPRCVLGKAANVTVASAGGGFQVRQASGGGASTAGSSSGGGGGGGGGGASGQMTCVGMAEALGSVALHGRSIDMLTIDIEGSEPHVLRCMPFDQLDIRLVLIETNKVRACQMRSRWRGPSGCLRGWRTHTHDPALLRCVTLQVRDMRAVDAFFAQHGYANVATLLQTDRNWLDNVYVRMARKLVVPAIAGRCTAEERAQTDCHGGGEYQPWARDEAAAPWGRCVER